MNNESLKKLAVIVAVSIGIFWMLKPKLNEDDQNPFANRENGKKTRLTVNSLQIQIHSFAPKLVKYSK